jgi:hypothetical protein
MARLLVRERRLPSDLWGEELRVKRQVAQGRRPALRYLGSFRLMFPIR